MNEGEIIIVGTGQGGFQLAACLRQDGFGGNITLIGEEVGLPYQRPPLSKAFLRDGNLAALTLRPKEFYDKNQIALIDSAKVVKIDRAEKTAFIADGRNFNYDHLILATGSRNRIPPVKNLHLSGINQIRTWLGGKLIRKRLPNMKHAIVIGGGFIGLEFAAMARSLDIAVTIVEGQSRLMARAVSPAVSTFFTTAHEQLGTTVLTDVFASEVIDDGTGRVAGLRLSDGSDIEGDFVLVATGVEPNSELAQQAGLEVENGVVVDEYLLTADPSISALGDCCSFPEPLSGQRLRLESVQAATDHARAISHRLTRQAKPYEAVPWFWSDQGDWKLQIAGIGMGADDIEVVDKDEGGLVVFCFRDDRLVAVETVNAAPAHMASRRLLSLQRPVSKAELAASSFDVRNLMKTAVSSG